MEPEVRAWTLIDEPGAILAAQERDGMPLESRGPLHGIPIAVKDIFDVAGWPTCCGWTRPPSPFLPLRDAALVARLRRAGAIVLGKTVTTPFAWLDPPPTRNPWDLSRTPGGSSSGSAAALASGMVLAALGSQTGGSLTRPAAYCGVAALKPTHGRLPNDGVFPLAPSLDHPGPLARTVADLALLWSVLSETDLESLTPQAEEAPPRLVRLRGLFDEQAEPAMREALDTALDGLSSLGWSVSEGRLPAPFRQIPDWHRLILATEAAAAHRERQTGSSLNLPPQLAALLAEGQSRPEAEVNAAFQARVALQSSLLSLFSGGRFWVTPSAPGPPPGPETTGPAVMNAPWSFLGFPTLGLPLALTPEGLPLGLQLIGPPHEEAALLRLGCRIEESLKALRAASPPTCG